MFCVLCLFILCAALFARRGGGALAYELWACAAPLMVVKISFMVTVYSIDHFKGSITFPAFNNAMAPVVKVVCGELDKTACAVSAVLHCATAAAPSIIAAAVPTSGATMVLLSTPATTLDLVYAVGVPLIHTVGYIPLSRVFTVEPATSVGIPHVEGTSMAVAPEK